MVFTRKFSQFVEQDVEDVVGLTNGANSIGPNFGSTSWIVNQTTGPSPNYPTFPNGLTTGIWMRVNLSGIYVPAYADNAMDAEALGVITQIIDPMHFVIQQVGYVPAPMPPAQSIFAATNGPLQVSIAYFLSPDPLLAGIMVPTDVYNLGYVSKPVFVADTPTSGVILDYRGLIIGDEVTIICPCIYSGIVTVIQNSHGFSIGNFVYLSASKTYSLASATTIGASQEVGVVAELLSINSFILQFAGYNIGAVSQTDLGAPIVSPNVYYLSTITPGGISLTNPSTGGNISRPVYISEQAYATTSVNAGYILNQRSLNLAGFGNGANDFPMALLFGR